MLAFSFIWSTIFLACVLAASWSRNRTPIVLGLGAAGFFVPPLCMFVSMATSLHIVCVCAAACVCAVTKARPRAYQLAVVAATMAAYGVAAMFAVGEARHVQALARTYAFESLTPRLAYEVDRQTASKQADTVYATNTMSARWDNFEGELGSHWAPRQIALEQLHAGTVNRFIASPAFGVGRMTHMADERWLDRGNDPPLPQPRYAPPNDASPVPGDVAELAPAELASRPQLIDHAPNQFDFWDLHKNNLSDFLAPDRFGLVRNRDRVAGFLSHRFSAEAAFRVAGTLPPADRLELVSLLKFDEPRVYISANLPRMEELKDAPTRQLDSFEQQSLDSLLHGEDIVAADEPRALRAMGAIRALKQCSECHAVDRGELLGAFSYTWWRKPAKAAAEELPPDAT